MYKMSEPQRSVKLFIAGLFAVVGVLLAVLLAVHCLTKIPFMKFTADPATVFGYNPLFGYISNLGIILWAACVGVCFLSAGILNAHKGEGQSVRFLLAFGGLTPTIDKTFRIMGLAQYAAIYPTEDEALRAVGAAAPTSRPQVTGPQ